MKNALSIVLASGLAAGAVGALLLLPGEPALTADHLDPPSRTDPAADSNPDPASDLADVYAWVEGDNLNLIVTFAGPMPTDRPATYDRDVLYRLLVSTDGDALTTENEILVRFGFDSASNVGVQATGIPVVGTLSGPVETVLTRNGASLQAGLFDDPFFFDLQGFLETRDTGELRFNADRNFFANQNITAIALQVPLDYFSVTGDITVWSDTRRFGGQL